MNIAVAQSGGPTCAINASLLGVFNQSLKEPSIETIYGSLNGIEGIINDNLIELNSVIKTNDDMALLKQTPATYLGSCRYKLPDVSENEEVYKNIISCFEKHNIKAFFYIGGNDSMDTVAKLSKYVNDIGKDIKVIGVPKTIDNDLDFTDHTPGFGSAAKYVATTLQEIIRDSSVYDINSVTVVEIMGRHAGWLTASSCLLRINGEIAPHLIYLPECKLSIHKFLDDVRKVLQEHKTVIVAVSEGFKLEQLDIDYAKGVADSFGHEALSGIGKILENEIKRELKCKVRSIELNVLQRCSSHISSKTDLDEAQMIGEHAVMAAIKGESGKMMAFKRVSHVPYAVTIDSVDAKDVANKEKLFPKEWINSENNNVSDDAIQYFLPLIQGEQPIKIKNGLPVHLKI